MTSAPGGNGRNAGPGRGKGHGQGQGRPGGKPGAGPGKGGKPGNKPGGGHGGGQGGNKPAQSQDGVSQAGLALPPMAGPARVRRRHWGLLVSFLGLVLLPLAVVAYYLWVISVDQYGSSTGFAVRGEQSAGATDLMGGLAQFVGNNTGRDSDVLYEFIQSQEIVEQIDRQLDLRSHYSAHWDQDPVFSLKPGASVEDLLAYWPRVVRISYDQNTGLIDLQVIAFDADTAQAIARAIISESERRINELNAAARDDAIRYAQEDLDVAVERLKEAREGLTGFRTRTQILDPASDIEGRLGVLNNLQQRLADALIEHDLLLEVVARESDPRLVQAKERIEVIRARIADERRNFALGGEEIGQLNEDYPTLISEYEGLKVDLEVAELTYRAALTALEAARAEATRQSRYLATYVRPTRAEESEFPRREVLTALSGLFMLLSWGVMALIYYSIRDRS